MTFSIVAWDPSAREWGVAVASKFLAAGSVVPYVRAGVGAVATQAFANVTYGPRGLDLLESRTAVEVVDQLIATDADREQRQVGVVDRHGNAANFTGEDCFDWAGSRVGDGYTCQGNILAGPEVVDSMATTFEATMGDLVARLLAALAAGEVAGGDRRGRQAAAVLVVREGVNFMGDSNLARQRPLDLRVDDHEQPIDELHRLLDVHRLLFPPPGSLDFVDIDDALAKRLSDALNGSGFTNDSTTYDPALRNALLAWVRSENLEMRWTEKALIDRTVLELLLEV